MQWSRSPSLRLEGVEILSEEVVDRNDPQRSGLRVAWRRVVAHVRGRHGVEHGPNASPAAFRGRARCPADVACRSLLGPAAEGLRWDVASMLRPALLQETSTA